MPMMRCLAALLCGFVGSATAFGAQSAAQAAGQIDGVIVNLAGQGIGGVTVTLEELGRAELTDANGRYGFGNVSSGPHTLSLTLGAHTLRQDVTVASGTAVQVRTEVDWPLSYFESITVTASTRLPTRLVEAPAPTTVLLGEDIASQALHGQLPRLIAAAPGVELTQSGLYDFNLNSRGFNTFYNPRILTRIDGRDPSPPHLLGYMDWAALSFPLDDLERLEFVRGPGAALYGAGAFNGVLNLTTRAPADSLGGKARVTVGELNTQRIEFRQAAALGRDWYFKALGAYHQSDDFARARVSSVEYAPGSLPSEIVPPRLSRVKLAFGSVRVDKRIDVTKLLTFEGGTAHEQGPITVSPVGRTQAVDVDRPWFRFNFADPRWALVAYYTGHRLDDQLNLSSNSLLFLDSSHLGVELQANRRFGGARGRMVGGIEYGRQTANSADPRGVDTVYDGEPVVHHGSVFGQAEYKITETLNGVFSARWDRSTLHDGRVSPRAAVVYSVTPSQAFRFTYSKAFRTPSVTEFFLRIAVAPPVNLAPLESALAPLLGGTPLGFGSIPILALGNRSLDVERVDSLEVGYQGILGRNLLMDVSVYRNELEDFITNLLPQAGTSLGQLNPSFGRYQPPASLSPVAAGVLLATLQAALPPSLSSTLSNDATGAPVFALLSYKNFGRAQTQGLEVGLKYLLPQGWRIEGTYSAFGHSIQEDAPENPLRPNAPAYQIGAGLIFNRGSLDGALRLRWVDGFDWISGVFAGRVPAYNVADLSTNYALTQHVTVGVDVANLFDNDHFELFGGDVLRRRALAHLTYSW